VAGDGDLMRAGVANAEIFAANRAEGRLALTVAAAPSGTVRGRVYEAGALRLRFPNSEPGAPLEAVIINTAGGMTGGDRADVDIKVGAAARLTVTTAAAEKIYRSLGPPTEISVKLDVGPNGALGWLPQATIVFDHMRLRRTIDVTLARNASLLLAEATVFGRSAMGENIRDGELFDRRRVRIDGALVFAETIGFDGDIAQRLTERAVANDGVAIASVVKAPAGDECAAAVRSIKDSFAGEVGISAWNGLAVARLVAPNDVSLQRDLVRVLDVLGAKPLPRLWLN
jgi:urease accessory protein